jgi:hypothetical protein
MMSKLQQSKTNVLIPGSGKEHDAGGMGRKESNGTR